ncbi:MAG TPA: hypothetical protein VHW71_18110 [Steroidobacteraceae bacterium]|jgi:hypothetical protein|nr:hypothetical protein [Steroidobacteraceae bacterium]
MPRIAFALLALGVAALSRAAEPAPILDNDRVSVFDTTQALAPAQHDFVAVSLSRLGNARFGRRGEVPGKTGARTVIIELKDHTQAPIANTTGYPLGFPRPHARKILENDKVVVWDYAWRPHDPTPMHFHDKDTLVVFEAAGALQSTAPDGKTTVSENKFGDIRFNRGDRTHSELLVRGQEHAVITELK